MNFSKDYFTKTKLFKFFFLILKGWYVFSALFALSLTFTNFEFFGLFLTSSSLFLLALQFYASMHAERLIEEQNYLGFLLGTGLALIILPGFSLPISILGLYSLFNKEFRNTYLPSELPLWLRDLLNKIDQLNAPTTK